ncbi:MAG: hypothetical protein OIN87_08305 [Candidatus Methanoperedens sp.]|nr:hypothetical protein [Candidatus Methanoperedens sp.]
MYPTDAIWWSYTLFIVVIALFMLYFVLKVKENWPKIAKWIKASSEREVMPKKDVLEE